MAGKSWQTSHEPPGPRGRTGTCHTDKTVERQRGGEGGGKAEATWHQKPLHKRWLGLRSKNVVHSVSIWTPGTCDQRDTARYGTTLVLFVVNSIKLHLTTSMVMKTILTQNNKINEQKQPLGKYIKCFQLVHSLPSVATT